MLLRYINFICNKSQTKGSFQITTSNSTSTSQLASLGRCATAFQSVWQEVFYWWINLNDFSKAMFILHTDSNFLWCALSFTSIRFVWINCRKVLKVQFFNRKSHQKPHFGVFHAKFSFFRNFLQLFQSLILVRMNSLSSFVPPNISLLHFWLILNIGFWTRPKRSRSIRPERLLQTQCYFFFWIWY